MAKSPVNVDALLGGLLSNIDKGIMGVKEVKKPKEKNLRDESIGVHRFHKATLESKRIILLVHHTLCACGEDFLSPNQYLLVEKVDKWGNLHRTRFLVPSDIENLPRETEWIKHNVLCCWRCLENSKNIQPVVNDEAKELEPVSVDALINNLFNKRG